MQVSLTPQAVGALLGGLVGIASTLTAVWVLVIRPLRGGLRNLRLLSEDWNGEPSRPGVPGRDGVMVRLARYDERLATIETELKPNHGSSMRDSLNRVESNLAAHIASHAVSFAPTPILGGDPTTGQVGR